MANWLKKLFGSNNKAVSENQPMSSNQAVAEAEAMPVMAPEKIEESVVVEENEEEMEPGSESNTQIDNVSSDEGLDEELSTKTE